MWSKGIWYVDRIRVFIYDFGDFSGFAIMTTIAKCVKFSWNLRAFEKLVHYLSVFTVPSSKTPMLVQYTLALNNLICIFNEKMCFP